MKFIIIFFSCLVFLVTDGIAQYGNDACPIPGDSVECPWRPVVTNHRIQLSYSHDQYADITYRFRYCNGVLEFDILGISLLNNSGHFQEFNIYHYDFSTLRSVIELGLIQEFEQDTNILGLPPDTVGSPIPSCRDTVTIANFFMASCGVFLDCFYRLSNTNVQCDTGFGAAWHYFSPINNGWYVEFQSWQKCGEQCCKRTYKICRDLSSVSTDTLPGTYYKTLRIINTNVQSNGICSGQSKFCKDCYNNCWNMP